MTTTTSESVSTDTGQVERKPMMTGPAILMMNLGFFGVQFSFGLTQSAVNPLFLLIGAKPDQLPILNLAGPVTGLIIQPLIGAISDRTWSPRWGRRRPFVTAGAILCSIILLAFPFVGVHALRNRSGEMFARGELSVRMRFTFRILPPTCPCRSPVSSRPL